MFFGQAQLVQFHFQDVAWSFILCYMDGNNIMKSYRLEWPRLRQITLVVSNTMKVESMSKFCKVWVAKVRACKKTSKTCVRCACVQAFLSWSHTTHVRPHLTCDNLNIWSRYLDLGYKANAFLMVTLGLDSNNANHLPMSERWTVWDGTFIRNQQKIVGKN